MWLAFLILVTAGQALGHGRVLQPPSRASAWRYGFHTNPNYDDDGVNCGGMHHQWDRNRGKCGICGDAYDLREPRPHEIGGVFGDGVIVSEHMPGSLLTTSVEITAYHRGFWQFKICPDPTRNDQPCFDEYVLELEDGGDKYYPKRGNARYEVTYRLPRGLVCDHCVLQWRYTAGNNWGNCKNGTQALGCGNQEQFGACSDIAIGNSRGVSVGDKPSNQNEDIPYPLLYYLKNGYFEGQEGILHLVRDATVRKPSNKKRRKNSKFTRRKKGNKKKPRKRKKVPSQKYLHS